jgi:hypothetical protein
MTLAGNAPYSDTEVPADKSKFQIEQLLKKYGVSGSQWTTDWENNRVMLRFVLTNREGRRVGIQLEPPMFMSKHRTWDKTRGRHVIEESPNWAQSMRLFYYYIKSKLEAVSWGLREVEQEFLNDIIVRDSAGRETTVGRLVSRNALADQKLEYEKLREAQE